MFNKNINAEQRIKSHVENCEEIVERQNSFEHEDGNDMLRQPVFHQSLKRIAAKRKHAYHCNVYWVQLNHWYFHWIPTD